MKLGYSTQHPLTASLAASYVFTAAAPIHSNAASVSGGNYGQPTFYWSHAIKLNLQWSHTFQQGTLNLESRISNHWPMEVGT